MPEWNVVDTKDLPKIESQRNMPSLISNKIDPFDTDLSPENDLNFALSPNDVVFDKISGSTYFRAEKHPLLVGINVLGPEFGRKEELSLNDASIN